jgi:lipopolysaccharide/colanic/teichoic acid biosynthesis glycosyltransferase
VARGVKTERVQVQPATGRSSVAGTPPAGGLPAPHRAGLLAKHALDRLFAVGALLVTAPVLAAVALALRISGPGPVLRREPRVGEHGRPVLVRSFAITADMRGSRGWGFVARTGVGALPQLWSVLVGEMSIVGPRPRALGYDPPPARPGLTGLVQLRELERPLSVSEQLALDAEYASTWSLALDARIVLLTIWRALRRR